MPIRTIPGVSAQYGLICFDSKGEERQDDPDGRGSLISRRLLDLTGSDSCTDIFLFSHGWLGDVPAAVNQYDRWIRAFHSLTADRQRASQVFPGFQPFFIGLHWPSMPWGDEELSDGSFAGEDALGAGALYGLYLDRLGDTPEIRSALNSIIGEARRNAAPDHLPATARDAFLELNQALELGSEGVGGAPDADREPFDPDAAFENSETAFGGFDVFGGILGLLRLCSYWRMKKRARIVGERGMHSFVNSLQRATEKRGVRIHLMGHSFGCIVISSILSGPQGDGPLERPIDSVVLVQGAVSLWSYAPTIPLDGAGRGYFHRIIPSGKIRGPLITTRSRHDTAVGRLYPRACAVSAEASFAREDFPKFGAIGYFGLQGLPATVKTDSQMLSAAGEYGFQRGKVYNLEASQFISKGTGSSGAHSDIDGPEVAHAIWQAAFASVS